MSDTAAAPDSDVASVLAGFEQFIGRIITGFQQRISTLGDLDENIAGLHASFAAGGTSAGTLLLQIVLVAAVAICAFVLARRWLVNDGQGGWRRLFATLAAACAAIVAGVLLQLFLPAQGLAVRTLRIWIVLATVFMLAVAAIHAVLTDLPLSSRARLPSLARNLSIATGWSLFGMALMATLRLWSAGGGLRDAFASVFIVLPALALFVWTVRRHRKTLAAAVAGVKPRKRWRGWLARSWPGLVVGFLAVTFVTTEVAYTVGVPVPGSTVLATVVILFLTPHLDALIARRANIALEGSEASMVGVAVRQTLRFAVLMGMIAMLGAVWASPLASGFGIDLRAIGREAFHVALIGTGAAFLWSLLGAAMARATQNGMVAMASGPSTPAAPRTRLGTLLPLLGITGKAAILALAFLSILVSLGVNVWPLITGLSVFGLAIGFGSQTLVKDIVSGLFFLADDAFRIGEYIETSGAKGTVEKISVRSVTLRNPRGPVATVPYGQISKVVNFSRDWAIEKIQFRVAFDTDVELVRKLFKKIGQELMLDEELAPHIIEPFKSQGIFNVEDGTLVVRGKFVTRPGHQTGVKRAVLKAVHQAFRENGIRSVAKPLTGDPVVA